MLGASCSACCSSPKTCTDLKALTSVSAVVTASDYFAYRTVRNSRRQQRSDSVYFPGSLYAGTFSLTGGSSGGSNPSYSWSYTYTQTGLMCYARQLTFSVADYGDETCQITMNLRLDYFVVCGDVPVFYRTSADFTCNDLFDNFSVGSTITGITSFQSQTYNATFTPPSCAALTTDTLLSQTSSGSNAITVVFSVS